ncbi:corticotropin-releasing factor receptor 1-like [Saccoglossus kowalevskii]|uniref:PDF receptor-like n=1 Tax=Saccoglossus kowalevskii TaxID=10224 RepID=A0ABM0MYL3_SACKO|nr:PREDICTED: PDF receptor-like [Saccoglossus kowalevskii]
MTANTNVLTVMTASTNVLIVMAACTNVLTVITANTNVLTVMTASTNVLTVISASTNVLTVMTASTNVLTVMSANTNVLTVKSARTNILTVMSVSANVLTVMTASTVLYYQYCLGYCQPLDDMCLSLCWPTTLENTTAVIDCPPSAFWGNTGKIPLFCQAGGVWDNASLSTGNVFSLCMDDVTRRLLGVVYDHTATFDQIELYGNAMSGSRILQAVGYSISLTSLVAALFIFYSFRSLLCPRTQIHKQLFISYIVWIGIEFILSFDYAFQQEEKQKELTLGCNSSEAVEQHHNTIRNTPILCETFEFVREYTRVCVFTWNFVEGIYLHRLLTAAVFHKPNFKVYYFVGWVAPLLPVIGWAVAMSYTNNQNCWFGYYYSPYYWLIEGPRNAILFINLIFLINIVRVLITKMRESHTTDTMQVKKAVKAALVLVPLLGVTNLLFLPDRPKATAEAWVVYLYFYATSILVTFQGFVCAMIFCFCNGEVQQAIKRRWTRWQDARNPMSSGRRGTTNNTCTTEIRMNSVCNNQFGVNRNSDSDVTAV